MTVRDLGTGSADCRRKIVLLSSFFFFRAYLLQRPINPLNEWEILREQIEYEEELGRGAFGVVYKAMLWERVGIEVFSTEISKRKLLSSKKPRVVAVKVLIGETISYYSCLICSYQGMLGMLLS